MCMADAADRLGRITSWLALGGALALLPGVGGANPEPPASEDTSLHGTMAVALERRPPGYPLNAAERSLEGWVAVSYVVKTDGSVGDALVHDSNGVPALERAALKAVRRWRFEPATLAGRPVEQCHTKAVVLFEVDLGGERGARAGFKSSYKEALAQIDDGRIDEATRLVEALSAKQNLNLYESSRLAILRSMLSEARGDGRTRLEQLQRAVVGGGSYLEPSIYESVLKVVFTLEAEQQRYADALVTFAKLEKLAGAAGVDPALRVVADQIGALKASDQAFAVRGEIPPSPEASDGQGVWSYTPLRGHPGLGSLDGDLDRVELRCDFQRRVVRNVAPGHAWTIPPDAGDCTLFVIGTPGARFEIVEHAADVERATP